jgi:hypothetical protein
VEKASNENTRTKVFQQVQRCLMSLVGGSGHLAGYSMLLDTFEITKVEELNKERKKYYFSADAYRESEFTVYYEHHQSGAECISGSIVLDKDLKPVRDNNGRIMLQPWSCTGEP